MQHVNDYWNIQMRNGPPQVSIDDDKLQRYCADPLGFYKYREYNGSYSLVRITNSCIIEEAREEDLKYVIQEDLERRRVDAVVWKALAAVNHFTPHFMHVIPKLENRNFHHSSKEKAFFFYRNGVVKVTTSGISLLSYQEFFEECGALIWKAQINDRDFDLCDVCYEESQYLQFIERVSNDDAARRDALISLHGHMIHSYKDPANARAVILLDANADFSGEAHGGTGKSLIARAISHVTPTVWRDAKNFNSKGAFASDDIRPYSRVLYFDDVRRNFNFEDLFSLITGDMQVHRKYKETVTIPFHSSPKVLISSNTMVAGTGGSADQRRRIEFEIGSYFSEEWTPLDEFGNILFDGWNDEEWRNFDNLMMRAAYEFMHHGVIQAPPINLTENQLKLSTHPDFPDFMDAKSEELGRHDKASLLESFVKTVPSQRFMSAIAFKRWLDIWGEARNLNLRHYKSNGFAMVEISRRDG